MKKIFVTITEFLENSEEIPKDREIYLKDGDFYEAGKFVSIRDEEMIYLKTNRSDLYPFYKYLTYIEIDCTPIYK